MSRPRIAIVGGGPAGLAAALTAVERGVSCILFERRRIGEGIQCAEGLFDPFVGVPISPEFIRTRIRRAQLAVADQWFTLEFGRRSRFFIIDRSAWQASLGHRLRQAGVEIREGEAVTPDELQPEFECVVDARGSHALARRWKELPTAPGFGVQWILEGDFSRWRDTMELVIHDTELAYYWIFPKGLHQANVGFGWLHKPVHAPASPLDQLERFLEARGLAGYRRRHKVGGFMVNVPDGQAPGTHHYRVGDAGGFASPLHGGGIDAAWLTGQAAVESFLAGKPALFARRINSRLGTLRFIERRLLEKWSESGPGALAWAADILVKAGPVLHVSTRLLSTALVRRYLPQATAGMSRVSDYYHWSA